jgi:hypothetical protein
MKIDGKTILDFALAYAANGWMVFPAPPGLKKSYKSKKYSNCNWGMTKDPAQVRRDWRVWPDANVALPTGSVNDFWVSEADTMKGHGVDGIASLRELEQRHGRLPETLMAETPSGSLHNYWKWPTNIKIINSRSKIAPGIDVKGEGGMVIAPPSVRHDGVYRWLNDHPIVEAPAWLLQEALTASEQRQKNRKTKSSQSINLSAEELEKFTYAITNVLPNDNLDWENWCRCAMAIYGATGWQQHWAGTVSHVQYEII